MGRYRERETHEEGKAVPLAAGNLPGDGGERPVAASLEREAIIEHLDHEVAALEGAHQQRPRQGQPPCPLRKVSLG